MSRKWLRNSAFAIAVAGALPAIALPPATVSRSEARLQQMKTTAGHAYTVVEYPVPTANSVPHIIAIDSQDHVWFSESGGRFARNFIDVPAQSIVARLDQKGSISEWKLSEKPSSPMGIAFDAAGDLWIAERLANRITRMRRDGSTDHYPLLTENAWPTGLAIDAKGRVWFTETYGNRIGYVDPAKGSVHEFEYPTKDTRATGIAVAPDGIVWTAMRDANAIGRFDPATNEMKHFVLPTPNAKPCGVTVDAKGTVWFSERNGGKIGKIGNDGTIHEYPLPSRFSGPFILAADQRGEIWFSELFSGQIGRFDPATSKFDHYALASEKSHPAGIAIDSKGNVWVAQQTANTIAVIVRTDLAYLANEKAGTTPLEEARNGYDLDELDVPTPQSIPGIVAVDRHDTVWFTQMGGGFVGPGFPPGPPGSKVGFVRDGRIGELKTPTPNSGPTSMAKDPCGDDIWISLRAANKIARIRDDRIVEYDVPVPDSEPVGIAVDRDHNVWVALSAGNKIGRRTPSGEWKFLDIPVPDAQPRTVYVDKLNEVWFAEKLGNHVGRVDKERWALERWPIPTRLAWPLSLEEDGEGNLWFAQMRSDRLGMLDRKTKAITEYRLPLQSAPFKILFDARQKAFWVSTVFANAILRFDLPTRSVTAAYRVPSEGAWVGGLDRDSNDCIWFSEQFANKIARLCIDGVSNVARRDATAAVAAAER